MRNDAVNSQNAEGAVAENESAPTARERWMEGLRKANPDRKFETDDDYYDASMAGYDAEHDWAKRARADNEAIGKRLLENPEVALFISDIIDGKHPAIAAKNLPDGFFEMSEDDPQYAAYQQELADREKFRQDEQKALADYDANLEQSQKTIEEYAARTGRTPEEAEEWVQELSERILLPLMRGEITEEILSLMDKGIGYDQDIAQAEEAGRKAGRNEQIVQKRKKMRESSDGLPENLGQGGAVKPEAADDGSAYFRRLARNSEMNKF